METKDKHKHRNRAKKIITSISTLSPFPLVIIKLITLINDGKYNIKDLSIIINHDPIITSKCLKLCNSAYFGLNSQIDNVDDAIILLGEKNLLNIIMNIGTKAIDDNGDSELWFHSISVAILSKLIYHHIWKSDDINHAFNFNSDVVLYICGLLHDIGKSVMHIDKENKMDVELLKMQDINNMLEIESKLYGLTHSAISGKILTLWKFPKIIINGVRLHHTSLLNVDVINIEHVLNFADMLFYTFVWGKVNLKLIIKKEILQLFKITHSDLIKLRFEFYKELKHSIQLLNVN